jgi:hypothetical protein
MSKNISLALALATVVVAVGVLAGPAQAACVAARTFNSVSDGSTYVYTQGVWADTYPAQSTDSVRSTTPALKGTYWSLSTSCTGGQPTCGGAPGPSGNDSGNLTGTAADGSWITYATSTSTGDFYATYMNGSWSDAGVDGCIDLDGSNGALGDPNQCMLIMLEDACLGDNTCFAIASDNADGGFNYSFSLQTGGGSTAQDQIVLRPMPRLRHTAPPTKNPTDPFQVTLHLGLEHLPSNPAQGIYNSCGGNGLAGYRVYCRRVPHQGPGPAGRDVTASWVLSGGTNPLGGSVDVVQNCAGAEDIYCAATLVTDSGFETTRVSANIGAETACGPTLADPDRPAIIAPRRDRPSQDQPSRPNRPGRE